MILDNNKDILVLIDGHALAFRMFFALERTNMQTTEHQPTWAVYGFFKAIFDLLKQRNGNTIKPNAIAVAFDVSRKTFRLEKYEDYKANRTTMPDSLKSQLGLIMEGLKALNIPIYTKEGFEGDDIIGTIAKKAKERKAKTYILTGDKDSFQLIDKEDYVNVIIPSKGEIIIYDWDKVYEKLGVYPVQVVDYKALCGDTSDNIPGIKGIGPKTAVELLSSYSNLDNIYKNIENITKKSVKEKLIENKDMAYLSQFLAQIKTDVDINFNFDTTCLEIDKKQGIIDFFNKVQFFSFVKNINSLLIPFICKDEIEEKENIVKFKDDDIDVLQTSLFGQLGLDTHSEKIKYEDVLYDEFINDLKENDTLAIYKDDSRILFANENKVTSASFEQAQGIIENHSYQKCVYDIKDILTAFPGLKGVIDDIMLSSYIKDSSRKHDLTSVIQNYLGFIPDENNKKELSASIYALHKKFNEILSNDEKKLAQYVELPLALVLKKMEDTGVCLNCDYLSELSSEIDKKIKTFEDKIYETAGTKFNINSPKQVSEVLFEKLEIKPKKKNKTGNFSTNAKILEELAQTHQIARDILEHRTLMKLKTTYIDNLPKLIKKDGKIHTHFNQITTTTGRLSSSDPNLQNIPIRTDFSNRIRSAFIPCDKENYSILAADYSQIELRFLAHVSGDNNLIDAFMSDEDIHTITASKIFGVEPSNVTREMRRKAKAVNFGLIYGQTRFGLASALNITPIEAQSFIDKYFYTYPKINSYITNTLMQAHEEGFVETIYGRKRYLGEELNSRNAKIREFAERAAINAPLQGSAADLIKMAMVELDKKLEGYESRMLLQVHDELVLEVKNDELDEVSEIVKNAMEMGQPLKVPLKVDIKIGKTWKDSK